MISNSAFIDDADIVQKQEAKVVDYILLLKPRVMSLVVFTGLVGLFLAPGTIHPFIAFVAVLCIAVGSGAAAAVNMWYDSDIDKIMQRTSKRPIPCGKIAAQDALEFALMLAVVSVIVMAVAVGLLPAFLLLLAILFYVFVYTIFLKRRTPQNIVIGGLAGAFPPLIGFASVTGNIDMEGLVLVAIIFMWTPPHFWALSLYRSDDYAKAGVPMLPVVKGNYYTRLNIFVYTLLLSFFVLLPFFIGMSGVLYLIASALLTISYCLVNLKLLISYSERLARRSFFLSIFYLFAIFSFLLLDRIV